MIKRDPFVTEVLRIIKEHPLCRRIPRAVVLVSHKFYNAALKQVDIYNNTSGYVRQKNDSLLILQALIAFPVPWLGDYEFEIRPSDRRIMYGPMDKIQS